MKMDYMKQCRELSNLYVSANDYANLNIDLDIIFHGITEKHDTDKFIAKMDKRMPLYFYERDKLVKKFLDSKGSDDITKTIMASNIASGEAQKWSNTVKDLKKRSPDNYKNGKVF